MKTSMFVDEVKRLRGLGLKVEVDDEIIVVKNRFNEFVLVIDVDELCNIDTRFNGFRNLNVDDKLELYMLCNRYVMNSVEGRGLKEMYDFNIGYLENEVIKIVSGKGVTIEAFEEEYGKLNDIVFVAVVKKEEK